MRLSSECRFGHFPNVAQDESVSTVKVRWATICPWIVLIAKDRTRVVHRPCVDHTGDSRTAAHPGSIIYRFGVGIGSEELRMPRRPCRHTQLERIVTGSGRRFIQTEPVDRNALQWRPQLCI